METAENRAAEGQAAARRSRREGLDPSFSLVRHLGLTAAIAGPMLAFGVWLARDAEPWQWAWAPVCWIIANFFEWTFHRFPMHRPVGPRVLYHNHSIVHHQAFHEDEMEIAEVRELSLVMMPWYTLLLVFLMALPIAIGFAVMGGSAMAGIFVVASVGYFVLYETLHTLHHLHAPETPRGPLGHFRAFVRRHHARHHDMRRMSRVNFNVTFPLADWVLGTYHRPGTP